METQTQETRALDIGRLEKQLAELWAPSADGNGKGAQEATRACVLNLVIYEPSTADARRSFEAILTEVAEKSPCRALILMADKEASQPRLEASVSSRKQMAGEVCQICCEQVTVTVAGSAVDAVGSAIEPLLVPDLPVYLLWKDPPHYEDRLFTRLVELSDRLVIDSQTFDHPYDDFIRQDGVVREQGRHLVVSDLNWGRLTTWRTLLASFWDVESYRPSLEAIDRVRVRYDPPEDEPEDVGQQALLVLGWLCSRLGWKVVADQGTATGREKKIHLTHEGRTIDVHLEANDPVQRGEGSLTGISLEVKASGARFFVSMRADGSKLETSARLAANERGVERVLGHEQKSDAQRLERELSFLSHDSIYEDTLARVADLVGAIRHADKTSAR